MDILLVADHNFIMPACVAMKSLCINNSEEEVLFHVIVDETVDTDDENKLREIVVNVKRKGVRIYNAVKSISILTKFPGIEKTHHSKATYYRLIACEILPLSLHKVLYIDDDVIVRKNLSDLWRVDMNRYAIAVAPDGMENSASINCKRLGYDKSLGYFNAGVMMINLDYWRINNVQDSFIDYISAYSENIVYVDQDVLNYVLRHDKIIIPMKYNLQTSTLCRFIQECDLYTCEEETRQAVQDPAIIHFIGVKPWNKECLHPYKNVFFYYQSMTGWKGTPLSWYRKDIKHICKYYVKWFCRIFIAGKNKCSTLHLDK